MTKQRTLELYSQAAYFIFGPRWQSEAARYHGLAIRTVQRWVALEHEVPNGPFTEMVELLHQRWAEIQTLAEVIAEERSDQAQPFRFPPDE